jgi:hypothetical protein
MVVIQASQKLLNTSRIAAKHLVSKPGNDQQLHYWYARLISTGLPGQLMTLYVHDPTMIVVLCRGKTIQRSWEEFRDRLAMLLLRHAFPQPFVQKELDMLDGYVVGKATDKKTIGRMNHMVPTLEHHLSHPLYPHWATQDWLEDLMIDSIYTDPANKNGYFRVLEHWKRELGF